MKKFLFAIFYSTFLSSGFCACEANAGISKSGDLEITDPAGKQFEFEVLGIDGKQVYLLGHLPKEEARKALEEFKTKNMSDFFKKGFKSKFVPFETQKKEMWMIMPEGIKTDSSSNSLPMNYVMNHNPVVVTPEGKIVEYKPTMENSINEDNEEGK